VSTTTAPQGKAGSLIDRIVAEHAAAAQTLPAAVVPRARRRRAIEALLTQGIPSSRDENWRYANLRPLERVRFAPAERATQAQPLASLPARIPGYARYVFLDGVLAPQADGSAQASRSVLVRTLAGSTAEPAIESDRAGGTEAAFALLNDAFAVDGAEIAVTAGGDRVECIELLFLATAAGERGTSYPRLTLTAGPNTRVSLIERHVSGSDEPSFVNAAVEVQALQGASVEHYRVQQLGARATWVDTLSATVAADARYRLYDLSLGALAARASTTVRLAGPGAQLALHAAAVGARQQVLDNHAVVEHAAPETRTEESFRGIAAGRARVAFNGKIIVQPGARGADSSQSLRGLLAGPEAEIDVRPQLEIYTDEVRCSHGATAGKLDDAMLFYLLSRGLDSETAQRLLKWAFLEDVVAKIAIPDLRRHIEASLAGQMQGEDVLKELL
jgi:Fe-S cluster assembly protein SufD